MSGPRAFIGGVVAVLVLAGCGSGMPAARPSATTSPQVSEAKNAMISTSTKMICEPEAQADIARSLGTKTTEPLAPTWIDHDYSCRYVYAYGFMRLSVKQLSDAAATRRYFAGLATTLRRRHALAGLGEGAFTTSDNAVVVRKDAKVLVVDVRGLPATFGVPSDSRANVAISVAATIMGCWTGA